MHAAGGHGAPLVRGDTADEIGRRAAAAADDGDAHGDKLLRPGGELVLREVVHRLSVHEARQASVGLDDDGKLGRRQQPPDDGRKFLGSKRTVDAQRVHAQPLQELGDDLGRGAGQRAAAPVKGRRRKHGPICVLFEREHARLEFVQIGEGLHDIAVHKIAGEIGNLGKSGICLVKSERPHGGKQSARRPDVEKDGFSRRARVFHCRPREVSKGIGTAILDRVQPEGVCRDDVRARLGVRFVNGAHRFGMGEIEFFGHGFAQPQPFKLAAEAAVQ